MGYSRPEGLDHLNTQFNIMALVGNGFDIQVLKEYEQKTTTRYADFYHFMKMKNVDPGNLVLREMESALQAGRADWSDVEACIAQLADQGESVADIRASLDEIRARFSDFLNTVVSGSLLSALNDDAESRAWSRRSLSDFLRDLTSPEELGKIPFGRRKSNYDLYNYYFVNFNYTSLLDNYLFMDSSQFDPRPHSTVDTNFVFDADPRHFATDKWNYASSGYVETSIVHPHGYQDIPRSLLFGTNGDGKARSAGEKLAKPYWARASTRYSHLFPDTHLFIVFGCSLGETDAWWWQNIARALAEDEEKALILYWWNSAARRAQTTEEILTRFFDAADVDEGSRKGLGDRICVVSYTDADERVWLNTSRA